MTHGSENHPLVTRRALLKRAAGAVATASLAGLTGWLFHQRRLVPASHSAAEIPSFAVSGTEGMLVLVRGTSPAAMVAAALAELGGIARFIKPGDRVLIKPNCAFDRPAHFGATTSPEVLAEVVRQCRAAGAEVRVTDNPINNAEGCFVKSGLHDATKRAGGTVWLPTPALFGSARVGTAVIGPWEVLLAPLRWATKLIGVPTAKSHNLSRVSLAMKNWYGFLGHGRARLHQVIHDAIADLAAFITPTLVIIDGTRLLMTNGPTGGSLADVVPGNVIAAGTDQVALDALACTWLNVAPSEVGFIERSAQRGLGSPDWRALPHFKEVQV
ncbi:MAG: DUF362 domain-containing protein [bacterium]|nr:DUF362 domain-containing protein [bacterium]